MGEYRKRILVIGSEGNIGKVLVSYLKGKGHDVYCADQTQGCRNNYFVANICNYGDLDCVFYKSKPEIVFNLAAMVSRVTCEASPCITIDTNLSGMNNVMQLCKRRNAKFIYFSTSEVYGNIGGILSEDRECSPNNRYGLTKYLGEQLVKYEVNNGLSALIVRPFMFYDENETHGEHRSAMIRFADSLKARQKIVVHKGSSRSWMHMTDAVVILERLMHLDSFDIINVGNSELIETEEIARKMCAKLNLRYEDYVIENDLPDKMTLEKIPSVQKQFNYTGIMPAIDINKGICLVLGI